MSFLALAELANLTRGPHAWRAKATHASGLIESAGLYIARQAPANAVSISCQSCTAAAKLEYQIQNCIS